MGEGLREHQPSEELESIERFQKTFEKLDNLLSKPGAVGKFKSTKSFVYSFVYKTVESLINRLGEEGYKVEIMKRSGSVRVSRPGEYFKQKIESRDQQIQRLRAFFEEHPDEKFSAKQAASLNNFKENRARDLLKIMVGQKIIEVAPQENLPSGLKLYHYFKAQKEIKR